MLVLVLVVVSVFVGSVVVDRLVSIRPGQVCCTYLFTYLLNELFEKNEEEEEEEGEG